jgi:hypothetical protein
VFFYVNGLHLHEALKFSSWFTSSFCHKDTLKVSFFVSFQFWRTSWYGTPCSCHFIFFSSKQLAIFLLLVFVYLISPSMILVVYNANVFLVVAFFNNVDRHCWGTCFCFLLFFWQCWLSFLGHDVFCTITGVLGVSLLLQFLSMHFVVFCFCWFFVSLFFLLLLLLICLWFHVSRSFSIF